MVRENELQVECAVLNLGMSITHNRFNALKLMGITFKSCQIDL